MPRWTRPLKVGSRTTCWVVPGSRETVWPAVVTVSKYTSPVFQSLVVKVEDLRLLKSGTAVPSPFEMLLKNE